MTDIPLPPGLMLIQGNQPEALRDLLVTWMRRYPLAPLETEVILAQSNGIAQWLKLALAADPVDSGSGKGEDSQAGDKQAGGSLAEGPQPTKRQVREMPVGEPEVAEPQAKEHGGEPGGGGLGIAAALEISLPARFLWRAYRAVLGSAAVPETSPFDKSRLVWRLMRLLPALLPRPEYQPLRRFLAADADLRKRFQLAERLADLFDQYQVYRADWLAAWGAGEEVLIDARGVRKALTADQRWQACLWRALLADLAGSPLVASSSSDQSLAASAQAAPSWPEDQGRSPSFLTDDSHENFPVNQGLQSRVAQPEAEAGSESGSRSKAGSASLILGGRAAVHEAFLARAAAWPAGDRPPGLPRRLLVFGISSLPRQSLEVLAALARWTQILLCVHNPCEHYWADIVADQDLLRAAHRRQRRRTGMPATLAPEQLHLHAHPLLAAWGKQGRDFIGLLDEHDDVAARDRYAARFQAIGQRIDLFDPPRDPAGVTSLLAQLQDDIRDLRPLAESRARWPAIDPTRDSSLRFHIAHSPQREVEILHDQLLAAFNADPSLTPRDVIVMVPDIDTYAPHIQAVFGLIDRQAGHRDPRFIPFSLADQGRRATDPLLKALEALLSLPQSRLAVSDLLDLLEVPALRRRFGIAEDELPRLHRWVRGANIRWGLHAAQRASLELPDQPEDEALHTWRFGLRRMLLGYAVGLDAAAWRGIEPFGEIGGLDAALLGPLTRFFEQLDATWRTLREPASVADWCARLRQLLTDFFDAGGNGSGNGSGGISSSGGGGSGGDDAFTLLQLETALQDWQEAADAAGLTETLPLSIVGEHWLARLDEGGLSQRFFAGAVTFATLMPMRAIPFRLVCLLGMNDGDYPRQRQPLDFDLMGQDYRPGDRSRREDDRYLFLEALLSARERLHISWVGRRITDNRVRPPSVLVGQLRDHLAAGWRLADPPATLERPAPSATPGATQVRDGTPASLLEALTLEHPLQPFSPRYFPSDPAASPWFTYAREWRPGADLAAPRHSSLALGTGTEGNTGVVSSPDLAEQALLPPLLREEPFRLRDLADFLKAPVKAFFTQRLGVYFAVEDPATEDQEPFALDHLQRWLLNDELIQAQVQAMTAGEPLAEVRAARLEQIRRRGDLAPGGFGAALAEELDAPMDKLFGAYREALERWPQPLAQEMEIVFEIRLGEAGEGQNTGQGERHGESRVKGREGGQGDGRGDGQPDEISLAPHQVLDKSPDRLRDQASSWAPVGAPEGGTVRAPDDGASGAPDGGAGGPRTLALSDWLGDLRANATGQLGRVVLETSDLVKDRHYRGEKVIRHWVAHLAANLGEVPLTTLVLSKVGQVELAPLPPEQARTHLTEILSALDEGLRRPLPLATKTAFAWLRQGGDPGAPRLAYEGGHNFQGEVATDPYLARVYSDYAALTADGDFARLADTLFRPLLAALPAPASKAGGATRPGAAAI